MPSFGTYVGVSQQVSTSAINWNDGHIVIIAWDYSAIPQGTFAFNVSANQWSQMTFANNVAAQNDEIDYQVYLPVGTYTLDMLGVTDTDKGISTIYLNTTSLGTLDWYAAANNKNQKKSIAGISVTTAGLYTLKVKMATKNAASTSYVLALSAIVLSRTA